MMASKSFVFRFSEVEVREREFTLIRAGAVSAVEPKAFRVLLILLRNPQKLIKKEELLKAVWSDTAVSENSLARSIALLRRLLGDDTRNPSYIETVATVGYRFVCRVEVSEDTSGVLEGTSEPIVIGNGDSGETPANEEVALGPRTLIERGMVRNEGNERKTDERSDRLRNWLRAGIAILVAGLAVAVWYLHKPLPPPRISGYTRITHDGKFKWLMGTDGTRLYINRPQDGKVAQVEISSGETTEIPIALDRPMICCVSPDGSTLLVGPRDGTLWSAGTQGGALRRLTDVPTASPSWSSDGKSAVYTTGNGDFYVMRSDGSDVHKIASAGGFVLDADWSPDGKTIRYTKENALWEISSSGSTPRRLLPSWPASSGLCCGRWTPDGEFFLFLAGGAHLTESSTAYPAQIWALDERRGLFRRPPAQPVKLTADPIGWGSEIPSKDGKKIFARGLTPLGELLRFDAKTKLLQPYLGGISAEFMSFSPDGKSVAYVTFPEGILWRANRDGSGRVRMSDPPMYPVVPRWSPDGSQILFTSSQGDDFVVFAMSSQGGTPRRLLPTENGDDATWSPDGRKVVFSYGPSGDIRMLDIPSHQVTSLPGSNGLYSPRWSPDGRSIAALSDDDLTLKIFDLEKRRWSKLLQNAGHLGFPTWSHDGRFIYIVCPNDNPGVYRVRVVGDVVERVVDLTGFHHTGLLNFWFGLDPTDAPLLLRDAGIDDIYALTLERN